MPDKYSPTWLTDNFPVDKLECQFYEICNYYREKECAYGKPCDVELDFCGKQKSVRAIYKVINENYVTQNNLEFQIELIVANNGR